MGLQVGLPLSKGWSHGLAVIPGRFDPLGCAWQLWDWPPLYPVLEVLEVLSCARTELELPQGRAGCASISVSTHSTVGTATIPQGFQAAQTARASKSCPGKICELKKRPVQGIEVFRSPLIESQTGWGWEGP